MTAKDAPRIALTSIIVAYFGWALLNHYSEGLEETLKNIVMLAVGFWLGSSKGSSDNGARMEKMLDVVRNSQENKDGPVS